MDKGKGKEVVPPAADDPEFLSAVISAAAASAGQSTGMNEGGVYEPQGPYFTPYTFTGLIDQQHQQDLPLDGPNPFTDAHINDLQNNEEFMRALQDLDVDKLTEILRQFGQQTVDGQFGPSVEGHEQMNGPPMHILNQMPALAAQILGQPSRNLMRGTPLRTSTAVTMPLAPPPEGDELSQLLHTKWLSTGRLNELAKSRGLVYKKGKFSATEEHQVRSAIDNFRVVSWQPSL